MEALLALGVTAENFIYANPVKGLSHLKFAQKAGIKQMTFDSKEELQKIA